MIEQICTKCLLLRPRRTMIGKNLTQMVRVMSWRSVMVSFSHWWRQLFSVFAFVFRFTFLCRLCLPNLWWCHNFDFFRPSATASRFGLMESCTCCHCCGGPPPPTLADSLPVWHDNVMDGWGYSAFMLTKRTYLSYLFSDFSFLFHKNKTVALLSLRLCSSFSLDGCGVSFFVCLMIRTTETKIRKHWQTKVETNFGKE